MLKIKNDFDLYKTITCGQIFRYYIIDDIYYIILSDRVISLKEEKDYIIIKSNNENNLENIIKDYFDLDRDYDLIEKNIIKMDIKLKDAIIYSKGLRMIHQDHFETLISYIISQNNRVATISSSLNLLSLKYGKKVEFDNKVFYLFPSIEDLMKLSITDFKECKVGFRDKYLYSIMRSIENNTLNLDSINNMNSNDALEYLIKFKGIGMKVASCILLFAYQKFDVFPVDTWVKKFMLDDYNINGEENIRKFALEKYNEYSGLAIQYMFNYKRNGVDK